jgi:hypothetical protein
MTSLLDLVEMTVSVPLRGKEVPVRGVDATMLVRLMMEVPELRKVFAGKGLASGEGEAIIMQIPDLIATVVGVAMCPEDKLAEEAKFIAAAKKLTVGEQWLAFQKIMEVSFPQGLGPFLESVFGLAETAVPPSVAARIKAADTKSPAASPT